MIKNKTDLRYYIHADLKAHGFKRGMHSLSFAKYLKAYLIPTPWYYQILLRKAEYHWNTSNRFKQRFLGNLYKLRLYRYGAKCGYSIGLNSFGPGLCLPHIGTIVVNQAAKFGSNIRIQVGVNIGAFSRAGENSAENAAPIFGDNIYIGPGAKIFGKITIGDHVTIGANAVVCKNIPAYSTVVGANQIINQKGSVGLLLYGDEEKQPKQDISSNS